jgi:pimeloyl-ACP methyl ester carboxylesterase
MIRDMFAPAPVPPAFLEAVPLPMMLRPWQIRASAEDAATMTPRAMTVSGRYAELGRMPVAILAGAEDRIVDVERHSARLHRAVPGSTLRVVAGLGHMVHHGAPEAVAEAVDSMTGRAGGGIASGESAPILIEAV